MSEPLCIQQKLSDDPEDFQAIYTYKNGEIIIRDQAMDDEEWGKCFYLDGERSGIPDFLQALKAL
jgi:hypothetical protein